MLAYECALCGKKEEVRAMEALDSEAFINYLCSDCYKEESAYAGVVLHNIVMKSAAGYYLGSTSYDLFYGAWLPYSRESGYFKSESAVREAYPWARSVEETLAMAKEEGGE